MVLEPALVFGREGSVETGPVVVGEPKVSYNGQGKRVLGSVIFIYRMAVLTDTTGQDRQNVICAGHTRPPARSQML
jgi:hypothetical protein